MESLMTEKLLPWKFSSSPHSLCSFSFSPSSSCLSPSSDQLLKNSSGRSLYKQIALSAHSMSPLIATEKVNQQNFSTQEFDKFKEASHKGNLVPLCRRIFSDHLTPVLAYRCLVKEDDREAPSFLLESVENSETGNNVIRRMTTQEGTPTLGWSRLFALGTSTSKATLLRRLVTSLRSMVATFHQRVAALRLRWYECPKRPNPSTTRRNTNMESCPETEQCSTSTPDKGKQAVRAVRVSKVVSALMLNANTNVSVPVNLSNQVLSLLGFVGNHPLNVLVDSGCSTNFVSTMLVSKLRLPTQQSVEAFQVELADGSYLQCNKKVQQLEFHIQDYKDQLGFSVMPLSHYDMILGQSWLYQYDPIISFRDHSNRLFHRNQEVELRGLFNTQPITMVSAMQVKRLARKRDCTTALVMLREEEDDTEQALTTTPVLAIADPTQPFDVMTDASDCASGGVLMQNERVIAFDSRKFSAIQMRYPVYDKEFLAIVHAYRTWKHYLLGANSIVRTDHQSLTYIFTQPVMNPRQGRWVEFLANFHMVIQYVPGLQNAVADALSRMPKATNFAISDVQMEIPTCFKNEYLTDKDFGDAFRALKSLNPTPAEMNMFASYTVIDELLYYLDRICVPNNGALRKILIQEHHEVPFAAHPGINKTYRLLSATYFWPQMQQDVIKYVKVCHSCQIMKASRQLPQGLLQPLPVPKERWESISMDFITTLPRTSKVNAQILVIVDRFSKMAHFIPCKKAASAPDIASLFVQHIFRIHGLPRSIISDRDPKFTEHFWTSLFKSLGTNLLFSSAYHPQTDGQTERVNQILEEMLRHYIQNRLASWEEYLPLVEFAYNNAPHSVTGMTPFQAAYGHTPLVPTNFVLQHKVALADQLVQEMQDILVQVRDKLVLVQQKYQKQANKHRRHAEFNEGDMVLLYVASHRYKEVKSVFPKLRPRFYGPFKIIKTNSVVSYKLELPPSWGKLHSTFHISWLKQYIQGDSPVLELSSYVPEIEDEHIILVPEMILDVRQKETRRKLTTEFLVKWMDLDESDSTWQTDEEMQQYPNLLQEFFDKRQIFL
ncbi:hypothetical protein L7F22_004127 [Adiantum nelumboides]|nr:hypothetical protein [Adiantum nelumboides]